MPAQTSIATAPAPGTTTTAAPRPAAHPRYFYTVAGLICLVFTLWGFSAFYFRGQQYPGRPIAPPVKTLVILHGSTMTVWVLLFLIQPLLIALRKPRVHMAVGKFAAALAVAIVIFGWQLGVESNKLMPAEARLFTLTARQFLAVPNVSIITFAAFVAIGIWKRRRPEVHRSMMLLATIAALPAAISRIDPLNNLYLGTFLETIFGPFFFSVVLAAALLLAHTALARRVSKPLAIGFAALVAVELAIVHGSKTSAWENFANWLVS